jgi:hypothetical protein
MFMLLKYVDILRLVIATLLPSLPVIIVVSDIVLIGWIRQHKFGPNTIGPISVMSGTLGLAAIVMAMLVPLWRLLAIIVLITVLFLSEQRFQNRQKAKGTLRGKFDPWLAIATPLSTAFLIPFVTSTALWLPPEVITPTTGRPFVGYVLGDEGDFTAILLDNDRTMMVTKSSDIVAQVLCDVESPDSNKPLLAFLGAHKNKRSPMCKDVLSRVK